MDHKAAIFFVVGATLTDAAGRSAARPGSVAQSLKRHSPTVIFIDEQEDQPKESTGPPPGVLFNFNLVRQVTLLCM